MLLACDWLLKYAAGLAGGLAAAGAQGALLTRDHAGEFGGDRAEMGRRVRQLTGPRVPLWTVPGRTRELGALPAARDVARRRRAFGPDVVHVQAGIENDPRLLWAAGLRPGRYAYTVHDPVTHPGDRTASAPIAALRHAVLRRAGLIFVHAEALRDELLAVRDVRAPIAVVPHGVTAPDVRPLPERPSILCFGRLNPYKGLGVLLDSMAQVWAAIPAARLVIAGDGAIPDHPACGDPRVDMRVGYVPEDSVAELFGSASVVVLPYLQASQSGVGSLAKTHARPLVVTRTGGLPELVADGSGTVVEPGDAAALAAAVVEVLATPGRAQAMSEAAERTARSEASWTQVADMTLAAYAEHGLLRTAPHRAAD